MLRNPSPLPVPHLGDRDGAWDSEWPLPVKLPLVAQTEVHSLSYRQVEGLTSTKFARVKGLTNGLPGLRGDTSPGVATAQSPQVP